MIPSAERCCLCTAVAVTVAVCSWTVGCCDTATENEYRITDPVEPFPPVADMVAMTAMLYEYKGDVPTFNVPKSHWGSIIAALLPAEIDKEQPVCAWQLLGQLQITVRNSETNVQLYYVDDLGAFSIDGEYYRGGSSSKLHDAIRLAYENFLTLDVPQ